MRPPPFSLPKVQRKKTLLEISLSREPDNFFRDPATEGNKRVESTTRTEEGINKKTPNRGAMARRSREEEKRT